jgi:hypothetical protein
MKKEISEKEKKRGQKLLKKLKKKAPLKQTRVIKLS